MIKLVLFANPGRRKIVQHLIQIFSLVLVISSGRRAHRRQRQGTVDEVVSKLSEVLLFSRHFATHESCGEKHGGHNSHHAFHLALSISAASPNLVPCNSGLMLRSSPTSTEPAPTSMYRWTPCPASNPMDSAHRTGFGT